MKEVVMQGNIFDRLPKSALVRGPNQRVSRGISNDIFGMTIYNEHVGYASWDAGQTAMPTRRARPSAGYATGQCRCGTSVARGACSLLPEGASPSTARGCAANVRASASRTPLFATLDAV